MAKKNFVFVLPLLTLLSVSPSEMLKKSPSRSIASIEVVEEDVEVKEEVLEKEEKKFERFQSMTSQIDQSDLLTSETITKDSVKEKAKSLKDQILTESEKFNKEATDKEEIKLQRETVESLVVDAVIFDKEVDILSKKEELDDELKSEFLLASDSHKEIIEQLIVELESNEELLDIQAPKLADSGEEVIVEEKEEEQDSKEEAPKVALEEDNKDVKKDEVKTEDKEEICEASEQVKVLTAQVEKLMGEQNLILQAMLNLTQVMVNMSQNMQSQQQPYFPMPQTAYQYHSPMAQGNWVYYPQGFTPQMNQGFYPSQAQSGPAQEQMNNWNLKPAQNLQFQPQMQMPMQMPMQVGQFGMETQAPMSSFNLSPSIITPMIGMS